MKILLSCSILWAGIAGAVSAGAQEVQFDAELAARYQAEAEAEAAAQTEPGAPKRTARRPRRGKKEEAEHKELFAFYEQSLF